MDQTPEKILPGQKLGLLGGGQLGRMFTIAARTMGYEVVVLDPDPDSPAGALATEHLCAPYDDEAALAQLAGMCAAATTEFENVPASSLAYLAGHIPVRPAPDAIHIARDRILEKRTLSEIGLPVVTHAVIEDAYDLASALEQISLPAILKTATLGYDGKGQVVINSAEELEPAHERLGRVSCVLEEMVPLQLEISVVLARSACGHIETYPAGENIHVNGILDMTIVPARIDESTARDADRMARMLAEELDYVGVLAVEFFIDRDGQLLINEIAPRPHNSGHYTLDACLTDQFQQQVRTLCGFHPGDTDLARPAVMINILGDAWQNGEPAWDVLLKQPNAYLHLYGKKEPRIGRKMGHFTCVGNNIEMILEISRNLHRAIR